MPTVYEVQSWNPVIIENNNEPLPMLYLKYSDELLKTAKDNNFIFKATISDTNSLYDGKTTTGFLYNSGTFPNCRPNFFNKEGYLSLVLSCGWLKYPSNNGNISLEGIENVDIIMKPFEPPQPLPWNLPEIMDTFPECNSTTYQEDYKSCHDNKHGNRNNIFTTILLIFLIFTLLLVYSLLRKN